MSELAGFPLNGCDAFMLAMDSGMRRDGDSRNVCHLLVTLTPDASLARCLERVASNQAFNGVSRLRLATPLLRAPRWRVMPTKLSSPTIQSLDSCVEDSQLHHLILSSSIDPKRQAPFGVIALPHFHRGPSLLFYWHHALCDAHGGEELTRRVLAASDEPQTPLTPSRVSQPPRREAAHSARRVKDHIFKKSGSSIGRLSRDGAQKPLHRYAHITFTHEETAAIDAGVRKVTGGMFPSALFLAATARSFSRSFNVDAPLFVPVPHDMRRVTKQLSPLTNQVSVAFFRLTPSQNRDLLDTTNEVIGQLQETIAERYHNGMLDFLRLIRRLPSRLLWKVIEYPAAGHPASFYFSDIGASLSRLETACGERVAFARHYPPNLAPPGLTTVWSRYRGSLEVTFCYDQASLSDERLAAFADHLRGDLLGAAA